MDSTEDVGSFRLSSTDALTTRRPLLHSIHRRRIDRQYNQQYFFFRHDKHDNHHFPRFLRDLSVLRNEVPVSTSDEFFQVFDEWFILIYISTIRVF